MTIEDENGSEEYFRQLHQEFIASLSGPFGPSDTADDNEGSTLSDQEFESLLDAFIAKDEEDSEPNP